MPASLRTKIEGFFRSLARAQPSFTLGQKCGMDRAEDLAVDLKGNVLTAESERSRTLNSKEAGQQLDDCGQPVKAC